MTDQTPTPDVSRLSMLRSGIMLSTAGAAATPVFIMLVADGRLAGAILPTLAALIFGGLFGAAVYWFSFREVERTLDAYAETLEQAAAGDLRVRLDVDEGRFVREGRVLVRLGMAGKPPVRPDAGRCQ